MSYRFDTLAIHAGQANDPTTGAVTVPIYQTSTFGQIEPGVSRGYDYSRTSHPTRHALEENLAALEGARYGLAFSSGMAAIHNVLSTLRAGDHVVTTQDLYGGAWRIFVKYFAKFGIDFTFVDATDLEAIEHAIRPSTRLLWLETPSNPLLKVIDIAACAAIARRHGIRSVVDNTFATPVLQQPIALGADVVVHSTTKYLGGHSDVVGGALVVADPELGERLTYHQNAMGAVNGPFDAWLTLRGIRTLAVRMDRHCDNAERVVEFLLGHPRVGQVLYPGLPEHPGHALAARQMRRFGGMVSFRVRGGEEDALSVCKRAGVFTLAESLGGVESLIEHPGRMTHASVAGSALEVPADLIRLSVGLEDAEDLIADLDQALD